MAPPLLVSLAAAAAAAASVPSSAALSWAAKCCDDLNSSSSENTTCSDCTSAREHNERVQQEREHDVALAEALMNHDYNGHMRGWNRFHATVYYWQVYQYRFTNLNACVSNSIALPT